MRLYEKQGMLGSYRGEIVKLANAIPVRQTLAQDYPGCFSQFDALYNTLNKARNDVMHTGAYARHATSAAIELCIHLEEALMAPQATSSKVSDYMVKSVVQVEYWHPVAHARQLMLTHSFSFLPVYINEQWKLLSELSIAKFLPHSLTSDERKTNLATSIEAASTKGLDLLPSETVQVDTDVNTLLTKASPGTTPALWLVTGENEQNRAILLGVLTPFELM